MPDPKAFLHQPREDLRKRSIEARVQDNEPVYLPVIDDQARTQAHRCMDCGVPFCQSGCPLGNRIPDWNMLVSAGDWRSAYEQLAATNNFPEFTGRICPAPCESACVAGLVAAPVAIEQIEQAIVEHAFDKGWIQPQPPDGRTDFRVAVVGSGPAGLACAQQLNRAGHIVTVYERDARPGGLLRSGVPAFKLPHAVIDRRLDLLEAEGIRFACGVEVGTDVSIDALHAEADAVVLCIGALRPRDLDVPGRDLAGVHFAWPYLHRHTSALDDASTPDLDYLPEINAAGKDVVVLGGGDTASDCIGTAHRQGAASITNITHGPPPPTERPPERPWPFAPGTLTVSISHEEGVERVWNTDVVAFEGADRVEGVRCAEVRWHHDNGRRRKERIAGTEHLRKADLVLLAIGYEGPEREALLDPLGVPLDDGGRVATESDYTTPKPGVFSAGDATRGASLVVWAIADGRECARAVDRYLTGETALPTRGGGDLQ
ncbi:MAG: glutamate synthase small subunit [Bacteroidetes bacterium]|jgi:glutamate synthase (NADPH/NADH) small chain|nr:glutamate synthase small subunit [Bacteroidota bacterium]